MANNATVTLTFKVSEDGSLKVATGNINKAAKASDNLATSQQKLGKASDEVNYKLNQGTVGTSSAARSFSKLNQAIGEGPNGLVGAYATLAANAFAVSAAFNVLRNAAQVEQMMKGLEVQGARTGRNLKGLAEDLQALTNYSISAAEAMEATALMTSAGFKSQGIKDLTTVANNAALALGRNLPDALDRISKGVTKLEPELLDELGIMTKLSEAQSMYALQTNKSVDSLTAFEKRQAMLNAVVAEGTAKFGGLSEEVSANPYDQLAATFNNLVKNILSSLNTVLGPIAAIFGGNQTLLLGGLILFVSTIRKQLLPVMYELGDMARKRSEDLIQVAEASKKAANAALIKAKADREALLVSKRASIESSKVLPKKFRTEEIQKGTLSDKELNDEIARLDRSIKRRKENLEKGFASPTTKAADKEKELEDIKSTRASLQEIYNIQVSGEKAVTGAMSQKRKKQLEFISEKRAAQAEDRKATAIELASTGKLNSAWQKAAESVRKYKQSVQAASQERRVGANGAIGDQGVISRQFDNLKVLGNRVSTFGQVGAAAFMNFLPVLGKATAGLAGAWAVYEKFIKSDAAKAHEEAVKKLKETLDSTAKSVKELNRLNSLSIPLGVKAAQVLTIQSESTAEIARSFDEVIKAKAKAETNTNTDSLYKALFGSTEDATKYATGIVAGPFLDQARKELEGSNAAFIGENFFRGLGKAGGPIIEESFANFGKRAGIVFADSLPTELGGFDQLIVQSARAMYQLSQIMDQEVYESFIKAYGGLSKLRSSPALQAQFIKEAAKAYEGLSDTVKQLQESFKATGDSIKSYYQSALPKTSFDQMVTGFQSINRELFNLDRKLQGGELDKQFAVLTSMPDEIKFTLTVDQVDAINQAQRLNIEIAAYKAEIDRINASEEYNKSTKEKLVLLEQKKIDVAKSGINDLAEESKQIRDQLITREDILKNYQQQEILLKSQQNMHNAIMKAEQELYDLSAAGVARRIDMENRSIRLQQTQLKIQAAMIDVDINKQKLLLSEIQAKINLLGIEEELSKEQALQNEIAAKKAKAAAGETAAKSGISDQSRIAIENRVANATEKQLKTWKTYGDSAVDTAYFVAVRDAKIAELLLNRVVEREDITNSIRVAQAAHNALQQESAALEKGIVSEETKRLEVAKYSLKLEDDIRKKKEESRALDLDIEKSYSNINALLTSRQNLLNSNVFNTIKENKLQKDKILGEKEALRLSTENEKKRLQSLKEDPESTRGAIENLERLSELDQEILDKKIQQLNVTNQLAIYEAILGNGIEDSVGKLQAAIALEQKRLDLVTETADKQAKIAQTRSEIAILRTGGTVDERTQKQFAAENAKMALEAAKMSYSLRIASIDAEYDLIEAKRKVDEDNFKVQALLIRSLWEIYNGPGEMSDALKQNVSFIEEAARRVQNVDTSAMRDLAKQSAAQDVKLARLNYEKAVAERDAIGKSGIGSVFANRRAQRESVEREASIKITPFEEATIAYNKSQTEQTKSMVAALIAVEENTKVLPEKLGEIIAPGAKNESSLEIKPAMKQAMKMAEDAGVKWWQYGAQTGHRGEGHKDFRAIDVYAARGDQEVKDPALKAKFDKLAVDYAKQGYIVIWNKIRYELDRSTGKIMTTAAKGHTTHMHVEAAATGKITGKAIAEAGQEAAAAMKDGVSAGTAQFVSAVANDEQLARASDTVDRAKVASETSGTIDVSSAAKDEALTKAPSKLQKALEGISDAFQESINTMDTLAGQMTERLGKDFGAQGNIIKSLGNLMSNVSVKLPNIGAAFDGIKQGTILWKQGNKEIEEASNTTYDSFLEKSQAMHDAQEKSKQGFSQMATSAGEAFASISAIIGAVASILKASSDAKIANIDKEIAAEQKRDGKSSQSLAKIEAMEKKKDSIARKAFNVQKKLMMAQAVMSTAAAVAMTLGQTGGFGIPLAIAVGAMGAAQLAIIAGTQYESSYTPKSAAMPSTLSIGKRDNSVDLARGSNANAGGEVGYLRGVQGTGTNASNYRTIGSAYGGELMRGYGNRGFVVGEKGPEVITPDTPITVTPANESSQAQSINASFNIQALDASGVQDILVSQKGNIIKMLREASNASGKSFMEDVNVDVYTRPSVGKL
jgi:hypothetical protein